MTRHILILPVLLLTLLVGCVSDSVNYQKGWDAAQKGDFATALREWKPLAEQGGAIAQYNLGVMYHEGKGVPQDYKTAVKWYTLAAEQGDTLAQSSLSWMYYEGLGVIRDNVYAHMWGNLAAVDGDKNGEMVRDLVAKEMSQTQLETAQKLAKAWMAKYMLSLSKHQK